MSKNNNIIFALVIVILLSVVCGKDSTKPEDKIPALLATGWSEFEKKNYETARVSFEEAIGIDSSYTDAYNGAGWSNAYLNNLNKSAQQFNRSILLDDLNMDAKAGLAFVYHAQNQYQSSISLVNKVLSSQPNWVFAHNSTLTNADLHLLLAESYFALANYSSSLKQVQILNSNFTADVSTQEGIAALAAEIERLRGTI
jgi:tetratricopeptide (TPR) repeat protein